MIARISEDQSDHHPEPSGRATVNDLPGSASQVLAGNVWEWTEDWWTNRHPDDGASACCAPVNPRGGDEAHSSDPAQPQFPIARKVIKGGSHLCADTYCLRYRPAARRPQMIDTSTSHLGFRCVRRGDPAEDSAESSGPAPR